MFNFVHHVRFLVNDRDAMVEYIQNTFGMKPDRLQVYEQRGMKNAIYKVGPTSFEITEPLDPNSAMGRFATCRLWFSKAGYKPAHGVTSNVQKVRM